MPRISSSTKTAPLSWPQVYIGVFFTTVAVLILELSLTRIFSVVFYYHLAFLAISIALFGLGAGGVFSYVVAGWGGNFFSKLGALAAANSILVVGAMAFILSRTELNSVGTLAMVYLATSLPFFLAGTVLSLAISETVERVERVYFFDLLGASAGCMLLLGLLSWFGGPNAVIGAAAMFAVSSAVWYNLAGMGKGRAAGVVLALALVALISYNYKRSSSGSPLIDVKYAKDHALSGERFVKWNIFSRIALAPEKGSGMMSIFIDADASTGIANFDFDRLSESDRHDLLYQGPGFPYAVRAGAKSLVIGPGGGWDVARALASGSRDITGVEINPIIATTIMRERYPELSNRLYLRPEVRIFVEDGRSFVRQSQEKYQVIQATLVDTWASTAAGAFALTENNLYTTEAFIEYLQHLTDDGVLAFTRWGFNPPRESLRLISIGMEALKRLGEHQPDQHVMVVREGSAQELAAWGARDTVLISRKPFSASDQERARHAIQEGKLQTVYLPGEPSLNPFGELLRSPDPAGYQRRYRFDITPVGDNRPFFFFSVQPRDLLNYLFNASPHSADFKVNTAVPLLFGLVAVSFGATIVILLLPPLVLGTRLPRERGIVRFLTYFLFIGAGYILIQVSLIQKFVLFLGHPTYALTVIIFSMLVSSGLGSFFSRKLTQGSDERLGWVLAAVSGLIVVLALTVAPLTNFGVGWPLGIKVLVTALLIAPAGFAMGMPFPMGLARLEERHKPAVRWAWSLNAAASVLGSATAIFLAIYLGLRETMLAGGALYLLALWAVRTTAVTAQRSAPTVSVAR